MIRELETKGKTVRFLEITEKDHGVKLDVRYSRTDNFIGQKVYPCPKVFLLEHVAFDLLSVHHEVGARGFGLLLFDGYRPWNVTKLFWDVSDVDTRRFLADPADGSAHNRGCAVDLGLFDLSTGSPVAMPSDFDEMNEKAYRDYQGGDPRCLFHRDLLRKSMESHRFSGIPNEWWHYNHASRKDWPVMDFSFEEILRARQIQSPPQEE
jgi:D-alanyl-D-alanine dipeptidase